MDSRKKRGRVPSRRDFLHKALEAGAAATIYLNFGKVKLRAASGEVEISTRAIDLVRESLVIDMLSLVTLDWPKLYAWYRDPSSFEVGDFRFLESSGISILHPSVATTGDDPHGAALRWLAAWGGLIGAKPCFFSLVSSGSELRTYPSVGTLGLLLGFQNADHFRQVEDVELFHDLGQRVTQLTYNGRNRLGSGCFTRSDGGLTEYGSEVVSAMNRVGMVIDLSHCGERTTLDAIHSSEAPPFVTHSNCRALNPAQRRCKSDRVLRELARAGGVIGITAVRAFVSNRASVTLEDYVDHFDHVARLVGPEHVGIGSDTDLEAGDGTGPRARIYRIEGLEPRYRIFQLADRLLKRSYSEPDIKNILGGNFKRALLEILPEQTRGRRSPTRRDPFCEAPLRPLIPG